MPHDGEWEFYPCRVNDAPASIMVDLSLRSKRPELDTLHWVGFETQSPGDHGIGSSDEADVMFALEDLVISRLERCGLRYVGRVRNASRASRACPARRRTNCSRPPARPPGARARCARAP